MPIHDWTRVSHGVFHDFHQGWMGTLRSALNGGVLPRAYYARVELHTPDGVPDVIALQVGPTGGNGRPPRDGLRAVAVAPPKVRHTVQADVYTARRRTVAVRASAGDRLVALIEIVSPGNKSSRDAIRAFVGKAAGAVAGGIHVLVVDLFPPGPRDPDGLHPLIWEEFGSDEYAPPTEQPLTLASYAAGSVPRAYVEAAAVGEPLPQMPLFLTPEDYTDVPLEATYQDAWAGTAWPTREQLGG